MPRLLDHPHAVTELHREFMYARVGVGRDRGAHNCIRGPWTMLPILEEIAAVVESPLAALPVPYRTTPEAVNFQALTDPGCDCIPDLAFPTALDNLTCNRYEIAEFAKQAWALGVNYQGACCGAGPHHIRAMAEALGNSPTRKPGRAGEAALTARQQRAACPWKRRLIVPRRSAGARRVHAATRTNRQPASDVSGHV